VGGFGPWLAIIGAILSVAAVAGTAAAYTRGNYSKTTIGLLNERIQALTGALDGERGALTDETRRRAVLQARVEAIELENQSLKNLLTGRADLTTLTEILNSHWTIGSERSAERHRQTMHALTDIARLCGDRRHHNNDQQQQQERG
jgi:hypothetical protein